jgi:hypothetical protein
MEAADFDHEVEILNQRYHQIEEACRQPFPASTAALLKLEEAWTTDDAWKSAKLLRWFAPPTLFLNKREESYLRIHAWLCLAAVRQWQLTHEGQFPATLDEALAEAGVDHVPVDPFSGQPLRYKIDDGTIVIWSTGPDGDDDGAAKDMSLQRPYQPDTDGDFVFSLVSRGAGD